MGKRAPGGGVEDETEGRPGHVLSLTKRGYLGETVSDEITWGLRLHGLWDSKGDRSKVYCGQKGLD